MMEIEPVSETLVFNSALTRLIVRENFIELKYHLTITTYVAFSSNFCIDFFGYYNVFIICVWICM
jgi:hypothetical protein